MDHSEPSSSVTIVLVSREYAAALSVRILCQAVSSRSTLSMLTTGADGHVIAFACACLLLLGGVTH